MGEQEAHDQQLTTAEELADVAVFIAEAGRQYSVGLDPADIQRNAVISVGQYISNGEQNGRKQNGRDMVTAVGAGLVSLETSDAVSALEVLRSGGRVSEGVLQMIGSSFIDRAHIHFAPEITDDEKARAIAQNANATVTSVMQAMAAGTHDREVALSYLAGVLAPTSAQNGDAFRVLDQLVADQQAVIES